MTGSNFLRLLGGTSAPAPSAGPVRVADGTTPYGTAALHREVESIRNAPQGTRNHTLNVAAFSLSQLVASGHLDQGDVTDALFDAARAAGLSVREITATLRSGTRAGTQLPRDVEPLPEARFDVAEVGADDLTPATPDDTPPDAAREGTSWLGKPVVERAAQQSAAPEATLLRRRDGVALIYPGKVNGLIGESESGKTWAAILAVTQALTDGLRVLFLDFEDAAATLVQRLRLLGITDDQLTRLWYADPDSALNALEREDLATTMDLLQPALVVVDGANAAMTLLGLDLNSNTDATWFNRRLLKPLASTGAAVIAIDHVPKNADQRGKGGIGAQAKRAMVDGCQLLAEVAKPFGKGQSGEINLYVDKDRAGHVRGNSANAKYAGKLIIDSTRTEATEMHIEPPRDNGAEAASQWQPTYLMEQISTLLEDCPDGLSGALIEAEIRGKRETVRVARDALIDGGWIERSARQGRGGGLVFTIAHPYREGDRPNLAQPRPNLAPGEVPETSPHTHSPYGVGRGSGPGSGPGSQATGRGEVQSTIEGLR